MMETCRDKSLETGAFGNAAARKRKVTAEAAGWSHLLRFELRKNVLRGEMIRLQDYAARHPSHWQPKDRFEISLQP
jgi:hypothetical protein